MLVGGGFDNEQMGPQKRLHVDGSPELRFVATVTTGGRVKFVPAV